MHIVLTNTIRPQNLSNKYKLNTFIEIIINKEIGT